MKEATSYRLTTEVKQLIKLLAKQLGVNETSVIELAVRRLAKEEEVKFEINTSSASNVVQK
jgi:antitoxin component of RelBE/YafQ-DinJ toxin-antitoxin module